MKVSQEVTTAMNKAKIALMSRPDSAFFTTLCFSLKQIWVDYMPTAFATGLTIGFNPNFFMKLNPEERVFLMLHETMHCAYLHMLRRGDRQPLKWNLACDHVINLQLLERGFKMPQGGVADPKYRGLSAEEIYKLIPDSECQPEELTIMLDLQSPGEGEGEGQEGEGGSGNGKIKVTLGAGSEKLSGAEKKAMAEQIEQEMQNILARAAMQSKMSGDKAGTIPGNIEIFLDELNNPKLPWTVILSRFIQNMAKNDYSWMKPNRRFFPQHHLPSLHSRKLEDITIAVDTSGSVSDEDFKQFISETHSIVKMMKPDQITLIQFDHGIKAVDRVKSVNDLARVHFTGRGGTDPTEVIQYINEPANKTKLLMFFTDGEFGVIGVPPRKGTEVLWLIHDNEHFQSPFGKTIHYELASSR